MNMADSSNPMGPRCSSHLRAEATCKRLSVTPWHIQGATRSPATCNSTWNNRCVHSPHRRGANPCEVRVSRADASNPHQPPTSCQDAHERHTTIHNKRMSGMHGDAAMQNATSTCAMQQVPFLLLLEVRRMAPTPARRQKSGRASIALLRTPLTKLCLANREPSRFRQVQQHKTPDKSQWYVRCG